MEIEEILTLKALVLTLLSKIEVIEKKYMQAVSKSKIKKQSRVDIQYARRMKTILKNQGKKN